MNKNSCILIIEDSDDDFEACITALNQISDRANSVQRCVAGDEAMDFLFSQGKFADTPCELPWLILLDLNLPGNDGHEVLLAIKSDPDLKSIPVVVLTSSREPADVEACYGAGANSYVVKPVNLDGFIKAMTRLEEYWFQISLLPVRNGSNSQ